MRKKIFTYYRLKYMKFTGKRQVPLLVLPVMKALNVTQFLKNFAMFFFKLDLFSPRPE